MTTGCPFHSQDADQPVEDHLLGPQHIPGPKPAPLLGWRLNAFRHARNPIINLRHLRSTYGDVVCLSRGGNDPLIFTPRPGQNRTIFAFGVENNRKVLKEHEVFETDILRGPEQCKWLTHNMAAANGKDRALQRRMIMPALKKDYLRTYHPIITHFLERRLDSWQAGETVDLVEDLEDLTADIICKAFYGQDPEGNEYQTLASIAREVVTLMFNPLTMVPLNLPGTPFRRFLGLTKRAESAVLQEIDRRREAGLDDFDDVLSMMVKAHDEGTIKLSNANMVGNAFALFLAGHDVPASAMCFTLFLLAQHPEEMAKLADELAEYDEILPFDVVWKLPVLDRVFRESLRVLSPTTLIFRRLSQGTQLGRYAVPAGTEVLLSPYITHSDPEVYSEPRRFLPQRWEEGKFNAFEFVPFSYGARKCLGVDLAELLVKTVVAAMVRRFRPRVPRSTIDIQAIFTMKAKHMPMVLEAQDGRYDQSPGPVDGFIRELVDLPFA